MHLLEEIERIRLRNLRSLHGRHGGGGGPTSEHFVAHLNERGVSITKTDLSNIYWEKKPISERLAAEIEQALALPPGWLGEDHEFVYSLSPNELAAFRDFAELPCEIKCNILSLIRSISTYDKSK